MINLIPHTAKISVKREYWTRVVTVWIFILSFTLISLTALLVPTYVTTMTQISELKDSAEIALKDATSYTLSSATLIEASKQAQLLLSLKDTPDFMALVKKFETAQNNGITITRFVIDTEKNILSPISLTGKADTRESLAQFRTTLLNDPEIETVLLPISNLAQDRDILFSITVTMKIDK